MKERFLEWKYGFIFQYLEKYIVTVFQYFDTDSIVRSFETFKTDIYFHIDLIWVFQRSTF